MTSKPGHYFDPVFSPDGTKIVYRKDSDSPLLSTAWSADPGLYWIAASGTGGRPSLIVEDGSQPRFGKDSDRVFFVKTEGGGDQIAPAKRVFASVELDGSDAHDYYLSELATEFAVSPDGKWLAFREGFNAYVTPFIETGRRVDIGPKSKAVPVTRVSKEAGESLALFGRLLPPVLGLRTGPLPARSQGSLHVSSRLAREAAGHAGETARDRFSRRRWTFPPAPSPSRAGASSR